MSELITCPGCKKQLQVPDAQIGELVQCPECQHQFTATATSLSAGPIPPKSNKPPRRDDDDDDDMEDRPRRRRRYEDDDDRDDYNVRQSADVPNYMVQAIMVTLCCTCWPFGIVAIVNAAKVNTALSRGNVEGAMEASENAKKWCWITAISGVVVNVLYVVSQVMLEANRF